MAHDQTPASSFHIRMTQMWGAVERESGGRLRVRTYPNSELGSDASMLTQLRSNAIQFFKMTGILLASIVPVAAIEGIGFAFKSSNDALTAMDGDLGSYVRKEIQAKGFVVFEKIMQSGMRQITSGRSPIRDARDLAGFKLRTPAAPLWVDLFKTLGASPTPLDINELYTALQTHIVDGSELPFINIDAYRLPEVQKYLSITNHMWAGYWFLSNPDAWGALPADIRTVVERNARRAALAQRQDVLPQDDALVAKFQREGMVVNRTETTSFRAKLGPYYQKWRTEFGPAAWSVLERYSGPLG